MEGRNKKIKKTTPRDASDGEPPVEEPEVIDRGHPLPPDHLSGEDFFSDTLFSDLGVSEHLKFTLVNTMKLERMSRIQSEAIPYILEGKDFLGAAKTGSGKTLAFLVPGIELLLRQGFADRRETGLIVISPTRELAQQIYDVATVLCGNLSLTVALLIGGASKKLDNAKLERSPSIVIATPGRLVDQLVSSKHWNFRQMSTLVIDEADQILKIGFEDEMNQIVELLPSKRQTILFSATQTDKVSDLVRLSMVDPVFISVAERIGTVERLEQGFVICESDLRFRLLFTFLKRNEDRKVMVFFSSCASVRFHTEVFNFIDFKVLEIHGKQKQQKRLETYYDFCRLEKGVLFCTDVAARGLDIPAVDWIVQFDPPDDVREYVHRVGRTCRGAHARGNALLLLLPSEKEYIRALERAGVTPQEYEFPEEKLFPVSEQLTRLVNANSFLHKSARDAYASYLRAYVSHSMKDVFDVREIDLQLAAKSFGLTSPPRVDLDISLKRGRKGPAGQATKSNFERNKFKIRSDKRQFSR